MTNAPDAKVQAVWSREINGIGRGQIPLDHAYWVTVNVPVIELWIAQ